MNLRMFVATACALFALATSSEARACQNDEECKGDRVCYDAQCVSVETAQELERLAVERAASGAQPAPAPAPAPAPIVVYQPVPVYTQAPEQAPAPEIVDDQAEVEAALGTSLVDQHEDWRRTRTARFPRFSDYMYSYYRSERRSGIIFAAALGPGILAVGGVISAVLFDNGSTACDYEEELEEDNPEYHSDCSYEGFYVAGSIIAGVMGITSLTFFIAGGTKISRANARLQKLTQVRGTALRTPRLELVGVAPLLDARAEPRGIALRWRF